MARFYFLFNASFFDTFLSLLPFISYIFLHWLKSLGGLSFSRHLKGEFQKSYYDYYSDDNDNESTDDEYEDSGVEESDEDEEVIIKKKEILKRKLTKTKLPPAK